MAASKKSASRRAANPVDETLDQDAMTSFAGAGVWGEAARDQYETAMRAFADNAEQFRAQAKEAYEQAREGFDLANERLRAVNADMIAAAREEMAGAVEFANDLARAKTLTDALEIQRGYWTKLFETRVERARSLTEASTEAARDAFAPMSRTFSTAFAIAPGFDKFFPFGSK